MGKCVERALFVIMPVPASALAGQSRTIPKGETQAFVAMPPTRLTWVGYNTGNDIGTSSGEAAT